MKRVFSLAIALVSLLSGCSGARFLSLPFDVSGRGLNSPYGELSPNITTRYIVFASDRSGHPNIYLYDFAERRLLDLPGLNAFDMTTSSPDISEDGRYIVFTGSRQGNVDIYLYDRQLRQLRNLTDTLDAEVRHPTLSADGNAIAFESNAQGQWDLVIYNRLGKPINFPQNSP